MKYCSCSRKHVQGVKFINAPKCLVRRSLWEQTLGCSLGDNSKICDTHFNASQWKSAPKRGKVFKRRRLNDDAVPHRDPEPEPKIFKLGYADSSTQTEDKVINRNTLLEKESLRKQLRLMEKEMLSLRQQLGEYQELEKSLGKIFTETQISILKSGGKRALFNATDMSAAICLHTAGPRAYNHLYRKGFPLPSRATLYRWLTDVNAGTLDVVIDLMENEEIPEVDKLCVLSFDEIKVAAAFEDDSSADVVYEPSNYVQLAIARGLKKSWKQPVYYNFNARMDADKLLSIINKLHKRGYPVVAIVSDLGAGNQSLWRELGISETKPWFSHPADEDLKIFVFSDTPHLVKLIRNHYVDSGLVINGNRLTKTTVQQTISHCAKSDESILFKITDNHINIDSLDKQKIKLATQLFSNTTASGIKQCYALGYEVDNACETADLFKIFDDWFGVFNSKLPRANSIEATQPYGQQIEYQRGILAKMSEIMRMEIVGKAHKLPFQEAILVNNTSLDGLHGYLSEKYEIRFISTSRLSQDIVDNFFGATWSKGGQFDHPTPLQFKYMLRKYITGMTKFKQLINK
uniref:Repressor n=1 Tax=Drosophila subsilvestris TaxID=7239 RepID=Q8MZL9_DROSS|nr:repressor [Drosophila subsilvestris]